MTAISHEPEPVGDLAALTWLVQAVLVIRLPFACALATWRMQIRPDLRPDRWEVSAARFRFFPDG